MAPAPLTSSGNEKRFHGEARVLWNVFVWEPRWKSVTSGQTSEPAHPEAARTLTKAGRRDQSGRALGTKWSSVAFTSLIGKFTLSHLKTF